MLRILIFSLYYAFLAAQSLEAQPIFESNVSEFKQAQRSVVVLRNEEDLLPLRGLDSLRLAYLYFGSGPRTRFLPSLRHYAPVKALQAPNPVSADWLEEQKERYDLFIVEIEEISRAGQLPVVYNLGEQMQPILQHLPTVLFLNGEGYIFQSMPWLRQSLGLIVAPPKQQSGPVVAAQLIFGGLSAKGELLGPLPGTPYRRGDGYRWPQPLRLGYAPPELVKMDSGILRDSIQAIVEVGLRGGAFPGAQVLVARHGKVVFWESFGHHTSDSSRAVRPTDLYDLASITKIAGALPALMRLHGKGQFDLDAPLKRYFPPFRLSKKGKLPFRPMLAHHARLRPWIPYWRGTLRGNSRYPWRNNWDPERRNDWNFRWWTFKTDSSRRYPTRVTDSLWLHRNYKKKIYRAIRKSPLEEESGYKYSGLLFYLLPEVVENITGSDYRQYLQEQLYQKLGAVTLGYQPLERFPKQRIVPTEQDTFFRMQLLHGRVHDEGAAMMGGVSSNAGLFANANDLAKLMQLYLDEGTYGGAQLIDSASVAEFTSYQYKAEGNHRGLGFDKPRLEYDAEKSYLAREAGPESFGHAGYTGTFTWADPESGLLLVFLSNRVYPTRANRQLYELNIRPRLHRALYEAME